jgi:hypothetical protein
MIAMAARRWTAGIVMDIAIAVPTARRAPYDSRMGAATAACPIA